MSATDSSITNGLPAVRNQPALLSLPELASLVRSGQKIGVGGHHFARLPLALLREVIAQGPTQLEFISWGGGLALEMLLAAKLVRKAIFCFSSLDIFGLAPLFRQALQEKSIEVEEWPALAMIQGFHAAQQNLPSLPFQLPVGSQIMERSQFAPVYRDPVTGKELGAARALKLDVLLLHAQRADEDGNVEIQGALGLDLGLVGAAHQVLVTVEEIVPRGTFQKGPRATILSRVHVAAIAVAPMGAYPASCLPFYSTDYRALLEATATVPANPPLPAPASTAFVRKAARIEVSQVKSSTLARYSSLPEAGAPATMAEQMVVTLARYYTDESYCSAGAVSPLAVISYLLAKRLHAPRMVITTMSGGYVDIAVRPMLLTLAESLDFQTSLLHCGGDDTYHDSYQPGLVTHEVVSAAQIDQFARTNNIEITPIGKKPIRLPGQGGMADVANMHRNFLLYLTRHTLRTLVARVDFASAVRGLLLDEERLAADLTPGYVRLVTNLGVFEVDHNTRELVLTSLHPGVSLAEVQANTGFPVKVAPDLHVTVPPTPEELRVLRNEIDPLGIRRLEFISGTERTSLIEGLLRAEERFIEDLASEA